MNIASEIKPFYKCENKFYTLSDRKHFQINDLFFDIRDCRYKIIESNHDIFDMSFVDPELYIILEEIEGEHLNA